MRRNAATARALASTRVRSRARPPGWTSARARKPRAGFVEVAQFEGIRRRLPVDLQAAVTLAFTYGWRRDEILTLQRRQLDLVAGTLCLDTGTTKNDDGREVDLTDELHNLRQVERVKVLECQLGRVVPYLFPHLRGVRALNSAGKRRAPVLGEPILDFRRAWTTACREAGVPGLHKHDLRR